MDVAQSNPKVVYAQVEAKGAKGGLYRIADSGATWTHVNSSAGAARAAVLLQQGVRQPEGRKRRVGHRAGLPSSRPTAARPSSTSPTPHGDNHVVWFNPDNPKILIETNDGGANITQDGGRSWSSQINQPTAEMYHVDADEQFPYRIYGPQQDTGKESDVCQPAADLVGTGRPDARLWVPAPGCESGQVRPMPSGKIVYGDCKGEFGRMNMETGQQQEYWINPQQRYGKNPKEMMFRFVRQSPIEIDAHNPNDRLPRLAVRAQNDRRRRALDEVQP